MEQCAAVLLSFPPDEELSDEAYHKAARQHVAAIEKLAKDGGLTSYADRLFEHVNPRLNSISYLALLHSAFNGLKLSGVPDELYARTATFLLVFDARQIRYLGSTLSALLNLLADGEVFPASVAVELIASALLRLDPAGSTLTSHHLRLVSLAYHTARIEPALGIISKKILFYATSPKTRNESTLLSATSLPPSAYLTPENGLTAKLTPTMVLEYDFLVALCYLSRRQWQEAYDALERVISFPTRENGCSKITIEAFHKWLLVGTILTGKAPSPPSHTPSKILNTTGRPYMAIAKAFELPTVALLQSEISSHGGQWARDEGNFGLIGEIVASYQKWQILNLREVYTKISLEQIRQKTQDCRTASILESVALVESLVQSMIDDGMLQGVIVKPTDGKPAYLEFLAKTGLSEAQFSTEIRASMQNIKALEPALKATNERLGTSRDYVRHLIQEKKRLDKGAQNELGMFESQVDDEDLMTGVQSSL